MIRDKKKLKDIEGCEKIVEMAIMGYLNSLKKDKPDSLIDGPIRLVSNDEFKIYAEEFVDTHNDFWRYSPEKWISFNPQSPIIYPTREEIRKKLRERYGKDF